ncbi:MAG: hypothetical protein ABIO24_07110, partial [Saprospiraceae bacterium]
WNELIPFLNDHSGIRFALVPGNHDRFSKPFLTGIALEILPEAYPLGSFVLTHAPAETSIAGKYQLCGHLHPGVVLGGRGRMRSTLPCFWFGKQMGVLPAFGNLTGVAAVQPKPGDRVVVIADGVCLELPTE